MKKELNTIHKEEYLVFHGKTKASNLVKSAVYGWFQLFERPITTARLDCQMTLLDDNVRILTSIGAVYGKSHFPIILEMLDKQKSAFQFDNINVYPCGVGLYTAQCSISYQSEDSKGKTTSLNLNFEADLKKHDDLKYKFIRIRIKNIGESQTDFKDSYATNRSTSLIHHCMGLIESNIKNPEILNDCLLSDFVVFPLNSGQINDKDQLINWISKINDLLKDVAITPVNINVKSIATSATEFRIEFDLLFEGKNGNGKQRNSLSKNIWIVKDDPNNFLPKIRSILVEKLEPIFI